jgi:hypothetical protein
LQIVGKMRTIAAVLGLILTTEGLMTAEYGGVVKLAGLSLRASDAVPFRAVLPGKRVGALKGTDP